MKQHVEEQACTDPENDLRLSVTGGHLAPLTFGCRKIPREMLPLVSSMAWYLDYSQFLKNNRISEEPRGTTRTYSIAEELCLTRDAEITT